MPTSDPLQGLKDIILPTTVESGWPALGWWLLFFASLLIILGCSYLSYRYWQHRVVRRAALKALKTLELQQASAQQINQLLKQVAQQAYPRTQVAALTGQAWFEFLNRQTQTVYFSSELATQLSTSLYQSEYPASMAQIKATRQWFCSALPAPRRLI
ncbi:DUF4381 domain-containing protein [Celerinatantimonas yamalensis]|uniref:DUF4381 domain-containing protein n=1 Tax=Celerinatantimonas yamalensis TaxID=559956 RepID=A0ABW9G3L2_9GAMM